MLLSLDHYIPCQITVRITLQMYHIVLCSLRNNYCVPTNTITTSKLTSSRLVFPIKQPIVRNWFCTNFKWIFSDFFLVSPPFLHFISYWPFFLLNTPKWWNYRVQIFVTWIAIDTIILDPILDVRAVQVAREDHWVICQYMTKCPFDIYIARFKG